jgi:hypothetical protein
MLTKNDLSRPSTARRTAHTADGKSASLSICGPKMRTASMAQVSTVARLTWFEGRHGVVVEAGEGGVKEGYLEQQEEHRCRDSHRSNRTSGTQKTPCT